MLGGGIAAVVLYVLWQTKSDDAEHWERVAQGRALRIATLERDVARLERALERPAPGDVRESAPAAEPPKVYVPGRRMPAPVVKRKPS